MLSFDVQVEYDEFNSLSVLGTGGEPLVIPLTSADIPSQVFTVQNRSLPCYAVPAPS